MLTYNHTNKCQCMPFILNLWPNNFFKRLRDFLGRIDDSRWIIPCISGKVLIYGSNFCNTFCFNLYFYNNTYQLCFPAIRCSEVVTYYIVRCNYIFIIFNWCTFYLLVTVWRCSHSWLGRIYSRHPYQWDMVIQIW